MKTTNIEFYTIESLIKKGKKLKRRNFQVNENFKKIFDAGFFLEIKQARNNYNTVYLVDSEGYRVHKGLKYRNNSSIVKGKPVYTNNDKYDVDFCFARKKTHKCNAMKELVAYIENGMVIEEEHQQLIKIINYFVEKVIDTDWTEDVDFNIEFRDNELNQIKLKMNDFYMNSRLRYNTSVNSLRKIVKNIHIVMTRTKNKKIDFEDIEEELDMIKILLKKLKKISNKIIEEKSGTMIEDLDRVIQKTERQIKGITQSMYV